MYLKLRLIKDRLLSAVFLLAALLILFLVVGLGVGLYFKSSPILEKSSFWSLVLSSEWKPFKEAFGLLPYVSGTIGVVIVAITLALPFSLLTSIYLSEYANKWVKKIIIPIIDMLSGIPPVIYGVWGVLVIVPFIQEKLSLYFVEFSSGYSLLAGGIVLAVMTFPLIISILLEVFNTVPQELRDASLSMGATHWQTVKFVLLKKAGPGIIAATVLGISRALGETIAVLMVCGNVPQIPHSLFDPCYPLSALIANNYGEMLSQPMYESALMLSAFLLFAIIFIFNASSRLVLIRLEKKMN
jgi:phosphate transport system permease protein